MLGWMWEHYALLGLMAGSRPSRKEKRLRRSGAENSADRSRPIDQKIKSRRMMIGIGIPISHRSKPLNIAFSIRRGGVVALIQRA
jgi:hypothetical protein